MYCEDESGSRVSPWHDIPLLAGGEFVYNFVCEIPAGCARALARRRRALSPLTGVDRSGRAKMEIATEERWNPIKQDEKKGVPRQYHFDSLVNYGALPQTWEDPSSVFPGTAHGGDGDPVDVVELGPRARMGEVYAVRVLGVLGMVDDGEMDWKVVAIRQSEDTEHVRGARALRIALTSVGLPDLRQT